MFGSDRMPRAAAAACSAWLVDACAAVQSARGYATLLDSTEGPTGDEQPEAAAALALLEEAENVFNLLASLLPC